MFYFLQVATNNLHYIIFKQTRPSSWKN